MFVGDFFDSIRFDFTYKALFSYLSIPPPIHVCEKKLSSVHCAGVLHFLFFYKTDLARCCALATPNKFYHPTNDERGLTRFLVLPSLWMEKFAHALSVPPSFESGGLYLFCIHLYVNVGRPFFFFFARQLARCGMAYLHCGALYPYMVTYNNISGPCQFYFPFASHSDFLYAAL